MSILRSLFRTEERAVTYQDYWGQDLEPAAMASGVHVTEDSALGHLPFYACVSLLCDSVAMLPLDAFRKMKGRQSELDPPPRIVARPYLAMSQFDWLHRIVESLLVRGNAYLFVTRDQYGQPLELIPIHPDLVSIDGTDSVRHQPQFLVRGERIPAQNWVHVPNFTIPGYPLGLSAVQKHRASIGGGVSTETFGWNFFRDASTPSGMLTTDQTLDDDKVESMRESWRQARKGNRGTAVLTGGLKWQQITIPPDDAQFLETRRYNAEQISGMLFRVPPHMIGAVDKSTSWGTGIEQQSIGYVRYTLMPILVRLEQAISNLLPQPQFVKFNVDGLLRGDMTARKDFYASALEHGWMTPNEVRAKEDQEPSTDTAADQLYFPLNYGKLGTEPKKNDPVAEAIPVPSMNGVTR